MLLLYSCHRSNRAVTVAIFYYRGGKSPTAAGVAVVGSGGFIHIHTYIYQCLLNVL